MSDLKLGPDGRPAASGPLSARRASLGVSMLELMLFMVIAALVLSAGMWFMGNFVKAPKASGGNDCHLDGGRVYICDSPASAPAAAAAPAPAPAFDPTPLFTGLGILVAAVVATVVGVVAIRKLLAARSVGDANAATWADLRGRKQQLMVEWSKYETDVALMIDYPVMTDYTDPVIHKVIVAMQEIRDAELAKRTDERKESADGSRLLTAVNAFEAAFHAAEKYARRLGATRLDPQEQRRLQTARQALNIILDGGAPRSEVEAAYRSLRSNLKGIIDVPQQALAELESRSQLALGVG